MTARMPGPRVGELKRHYLLRMVLLYLAVALGIVSIVFVVFVLGGIADRTMGSVLGLAALGLPVTLFVAWARARARPGGRSAARPSPARWKQMQDLLNAALEVCTDERPAFIAGACAGDPALRDEIESLVAAHTRDGLLDRTPPGLAAPPVDSLASGFPVPGQTFGRYRILARLGGGGMGIVYRARDTRLHRDVALKFLPPHLAADAGARDRFLVEARAAAALDHANICTIHEVGESDDGHVFLALAFYEGETLKQCLANGPLPPGQAIDFASQVAQGLAIAHDRGIVHRDIKPANLIVTTGGVVKIVDFGVAKLTDVTLTSPGMTPGTVAYMSPEQAAGEEVDCRSDLWSLGVVLYEMLAGERPFRGGNDRVPGALESADPAPISELRPDVPGPLADVVSRALVKPREDRYQTARDMVRALEDVGALVAGSRGHPIRDAAARSGQSPAPRPSVGNAVSGVPVDGERRHATIVACTISSYDVLVGSLAPAAMGRLADRIHEAAVEAADRHGGTLNRRAGDEIVLLFGVPAAREDDAVRAARSALDLHALVRDVSDSMELQGGPAFRLHTGIDIGRVIVHAQPDGSGEGPYRVVGAAAQVAVQLAAHAGIDEVWASPECQRLIGPFFETEPRSALAVRDREQPLIPFRVLAESGFRTRLEAAEKLGLTAYTGREAELRTLEHALDAALRGEGQLITVTGDPGIGKSRLLHEFRTMVRSDRASCLLGWCQPDAGAVPYLPFIEILRTALQVGEPGDAGVLERTVERIREIGPELEEYIPLYLHLLSMSGPRFQLPGHLKGDALRVVIEEAIAALLTLKAQHHPMVVLLEDWQWVDEASRSALAQVAEVVSGYPLMFVVTCRSADGVNWSNASRYTSIPLRPLDPDVMAALLESFLHVRTVPAGLSALLHRRTGGNPFFLEEMCRALLEQGALRIEGGTAVATGPLQMFDLPDSIETVIRTRLDRLDGPARDLLRLASIVGRDFTRVILERTVADADSLPEALETLRAAGLVRQTHVVPDVMYRFNHVLTQEVAYASLLEHQRRDLHGRVGTAIERLGRDRIDDSLDRLAHHFSRAREWRKALEYGMRSAERAGALAQYMEALQILDRTQRWLIHLPAGTERQDALLEILLRQERLCETMGQRGRQRRLINELIRLLEPDGDRVMLAEALLRQGDVCALLGRFADSEVALQRSLRIRRQLADEAGERKALRSLGLLRWFQGRNEEALACASDVVAMDRERDDIVALVGDITSLAGVLRAMDRRAQARMRLEEGYDIAEDAIAAGSVATGDLRVRQAYILNGLALLYREEGDLDAAMDCLARSETIAEVRRLPTYLPYHHAIAAHILLQQGRIEECLARYRVVVEMARKAQYVPGLSLTLRMLAELLLGLNRYAEALPCLREAAGLFAQLEDREAEALMWSGFARACVSEGDHAGAAAAWTRTRELRRALGNAAGEMEALEGLAAATRTLTVGSADALGYCHEALHLALSLEDRAAEGRLRNTVAILEWNRGNFTQALPHYERAWTIFTELHDTASAGLMLNSIAITLKQLGRRAEAQRTFEDAVALHRETGQQQLEGHALAALGDISSEAGETERAVEYYERSLEIRRHISDRRGEGWMLYNLARSGIAADPEPSGERVARAAAIALACQDHELAVACDELRHSSG